jgi:glyoxylase-like metal-dependent hydrolase (beta-lactamase superfamily II)
MLGACAFASLGLSSAASANNQDGSTKAAVVKLDRAKRAELMADYPNPAWGTKNWYLNELVQLEDNLYTYANKDNTRTFVLVTDKGVVVGDPISDEDARSLRQKIRAVTNLPVTHVIYSHNHWDHIKGARIFKEEGAKIISHVGCRAKFIDRPHPKVVMPDYTFDGDHILDVGNERIELRYFGENHSSCLVFPLLKGGKYMFVVDVVSPGAVPWGIVPDTNFVGSIRTLEQLEKIDFKIAIPGHGAPMVPKSALTERRLYITALYEAVRDELAPAGFQPSFYTNVERRMEPWSYLRSFKTQFRQNLETMLYYVGIGE